VIFRPFSATAIKENGFCLENNCMGSGTLLESIICEHSSKNATVFSGPKLI